MQCTTINSFKYIFDYDFLQQYETITKTPFNNLRKLLLCPSIFVSNMSKVYKCLPSLLQSSWKSIEIITINALCRQVWSCQQGVYGDGLAWTSVQQSWLIEGEASWNLQPQEEVCKRQTRIVTVFPDRFSLRQAQHLCHVCYSLLSQPSIHEAVQVKLSELDLGCEDRALFIWIW